MSKTIELRKAAQLLEVGQMVQLIYPSSKGGLPQGRIGTVVEKFPKMFKIEVPPHAGGGYRTFAYSRVIGDITILGG